MIGISLNLPAMSTLLDGATAIEMDVSKEGMHVRACSPTSKNAIPLEIASRGNASATVEGPLEDLLHQRGMGFYRLRLHQSGWLVGEPEKRPDVPPAKHIPWIRLKELGVQKPVELGKLTDWVELVRAAHFTVANQRRTIGRPTKEVRQAEEIMHQFHKLAVELIGPTLSDHEMKMLIALGKRLEDQKIED